jgi:hypothetical protein
VQSAYIQNETKRQNEMISSTLFPFTLLNGDLALIGRRSSIPFLIPEDFLSFNYQPQQPPRLEMCLAASGEYSESLRVLNDKLFISHPS